MEQVFNQAQLELLNTPLDEDEIEFKQGNAYIKGHIAIAKANRIFGPGNWGYTWHSIEVLDTGIDNSNKNRIYRVRVAVSLEVRGCMAITEIGDCESQGTNAAAMSMAEKGAVTDGLKRCLKNYGPAFGLDLYSGEYKPNKVINIKRSYPPAQAVVSKPANTCEKCQAVMRFKAKQKSPKNGLLYDIWECPTDSKHNIYKEVAG